MHLESVTLRGFKSFASRAHLELEPGLVAVVGPNGAGKSNLIDALAWALGTQSTRALRAERMEDVIFTGTITRPALGMTQVVLTFDNSTGEFPLEFSQVQMGRSLYRDGASEYTINGAACRLLDVHELLSEAGIGRELHAVVAQGQVDEIVQSRPEELRAFVEEAAGISKHRRRKERALRKIEHVEQDIARASDLAAELRRQLRPLQAQADQARRYQEITERLRELRIRLAVGELEDVERERNRVLASRDEAGAELAAVRGRVEVLRSERAEAERRLEAVRTDSSRTRRGLEHLRAAQSAVLRTVVILRERARATPDARRRDVLVAKRAALEAEELEVRGAHDAAVARLEERESRVSSMRTARAAAADEAASAARELADVRDEMRAVEVESRAAAEAALTARAEAMGAAERFDRASERIGRLEQQTDGLRHDIERLDADAGRAGMTVERLEAERREAHGLLEEAERKLRSIESEAAVLAGRLESLKVARDLTASRRQAAEAFRAEHAPDLGVRGVIGEVIRVASGLEAAVEAALGPALDAVVVSGARLADAVARAEGDERDVMIAATVATEPARPRPEAARPLAESIEAPGWLRGTVDALLEDTWLVDSWDDAVRSAGSHPEATFVTPAGRILRPRGLSRPARSGRQSVIGLASALDRTQEAVTRLDAERGRWTTNRDRRRSDVERLDADLEAARSTLHEIEGRIAAAADRLRELGAEEHAGTLERDLAARDRDDRLRKAEVATARGAELADRATELREAEATLGARVAELEGRLASIDDETRTLEAGLTELLTTGASLAERLRGVERAKAEVRAEEADDRAPPADPADLAQAEEVLARVEAVVGRTETAVRDLLADEEQVEDDVRRISAETQRLEVQAASLEPRALSASETLTRLDIRFEEIGLRLARDLDVPPSMARREFPLDADPDVLRAEETRLDGELRRMGPVNPLAAEEIVALDERKVFLETQLEDLRRSRRDLLKLVRAAEEKMRELLVSAVDDADGRFGEVIALLFPEGDGRLRLRSGDDPLEAGLELEVRLGRKGHRRLGFLSGGEKALAGLGFLFALHLARPTPFLVLDEVDAPLDDANLGRFLRLLDSLRHRTQVLVVTHQRRTMERADTLVGVTLGPDGTSQIVTERLSDHAAADDADAAAVERSPA